MTRRRPVLFSVFLTLLAVCCSLVAVPTAPAQTPADFVVLGDEGIRIEKDSTIAGGDVGANRASAGPFLSHGVEVALDKHVRLLNPTSRVLGNRVYLDKDVQVFDVLTNSLSGPGTVSGQVITPLALPLVPVLPAVPPVTPGTQDITVPKQGSVTLQAGSYGVLTVAKEATVTLTGGLYHFAAWAIDKQVRIHLAAPVEIRIAGRLKIDKEATIGPAPGTTLTAADILLLVTGLNGATGVIDASPKAADVGKQSTVRAKLYVPHGTLRIDKDSTVTGALLGKWVEIGKNGGLTFEGGFGLGQPPSPPNITSFTPTSGNVGDVVTMTGTNFDPVPANNQVKFNGKPAIITSATETTILTTVPQGATTGRITITTPVGMAISGQDFTVQNALDFALVPLPGAGSAAHVGTTTYQVKINNVGSSSFTGLVNLNVGGLPAGVTATFNPPQATVNQASTLLLTSTAAATPGTYPLLITGSGTVDGGIVERTAQAQLTILSAGTSTLSGRVLAAKDSAPIPGVTITLNGLTTTTDAGGNFLLQDVPAGPHIVFVDGATASSPAATYPIVPVPVTIVSGQDNGLPYPIFLHEVSTTFTPIDPSVDTIVTDPSLPNFALRIPAGVTIIGWDGQPNTRISVAAVPRDRNALAPMADGLVASTPYLFYFGKPGGGTPSQPLPVTFPNEFGTEPGTKVDLYYYDESLTPDPASNQWKTFGTGTVSDDGLQVVSDPGVGIPKFCCGGGRYIPPPPPPPIDDNPTTGGDPVVLATGQVAIEATDLVLPGRQPVVIRRAYRSLSASFSAVGTLGLFGAQTTLPSYNDTLRPSGTQALAYVSGFGQSLLTRQADGTYRNAVRPGLRGLVATRNPDGSGQVRLKDGMVLTFDVNGRLVERRDRNGNAITIVRDGSGRITEIREPAGRALTFQYGSGNQISSITDLSGRVVRYTYDAFGRLLQVTNPAGGVTSYAYDGFSRLRTITDARGLTFLTNEYDSAGRVITQTQADGGVWQFAYTVSAGVITQTVVTDPAGKRTTHRFNGQGYPLAQTDGLGQTTTFTRDPATNQLLATTDALGRTTRFTYDAAGNTTSITDPDGKVTRFEYEPTWNRVTTITDALNGVTTFTYDVKGNLLTTTDPTGAITTIAYNSFGQPTGVTDALGNTTSFAYDTDGNLITTTDALGNRTHRAYDAVSRLVSLTNPRGFTAQFGYDPLNRVTQITDALNGLTAFTYDPNGNLLTVQDAKAQTTTYTYDSMDRLKTRTDALTRLEQYVYDLAGNLAQFTDRKHQQATFTYDALNRRTRADYADGSFTTFTYDAGGRLTRAVDSTSDAIDFFYDNLDRLILEVTLQGAVAYEYDAIGRRTKMTVAGQVPVTYQYDAASRLTQVAQGSLIVGLGYDAAGRRTSLTYPNGTSSSYAYDPASRLTNITHDGPGGVIEALTYTYDAAGNRTSLTRANGAASLLPAAVASVSYDAANEQTAFAGATLTYDQNGNLTNDGTNTYTWDARNRLIGISGGTSASFSYDALGRRVSKTVNSVGSQYLYDRNDIVAEIGGGPVVATYLRSLNIDEPFAQQMNAAEYYHADGLNSTSVISYTSGTSGPRYSYEPFGRTTLSEASSNSFQFTGRENDQTGLYYYRARYYQPQLQRFLSEDPANLASIQLLRQAFPREGSIVFSKLQLQPIQHNQYAYSVNSPITVIDPTGQVATIIGGALGGAIAGGFAGAITGGASSYLTGGTLGDALTGAATGAVVGAVVGGVAGAAVGAGIPTGLTGIPGFSYIPYNPWQPFWWAFDVALGAGERASLSSKLGALAGALLDPITNPTPAYGNISGRQK